MGKARPWLEEGHAIIEEFEMMWRFAGLAFALLHCGDRERALAVAQEDAAKCATSGHQFLELQLRIELAEVAARSGHEAESRAALDRARDLAARIECRILVPATHEAAAALAATLGDTTQQHMELHEARRLDRALGAAGHAERLGRELGESQLVEKLRPR